MRHIIFVAVAGVLLLASPAAAGQAAPCCKHTYTDAVAVLLSMDPLTPAAAPVRQSAVARFWKPVRVGDRVLMGKYIIEHDTDRMARGEPCTHIYDFYTRKLVLSFHCTHLTGPRNETATVMIQTTPDFAIAKMTQFQFAGETEAHGVPQDGR